MAPQRNDAGRWDMSGNPPIGAGRSTPEPPDSGRWDMSGNPPIGAERSTPERTTSRTPDPPGLSSAQQEEYRAYRRSGFAQDPVRFPTFVQPKGWWEKDISEHFGEAVGRVATELNPIELGKGLWQIARHPFKTGQALGAAQREQFGKARTAASEGRYSEMLGHGVASAIPLLGPAAAEIGERGGRGELGSALGSVAGMAIPGAAVKSFGALRGVGRAVPKKAPDIPMSLAERLRARGSVTAPAVTKVESLSRKLFTSEGRFNRLRAIQQQAIGAWASRVVEGISPTAGARATVAAGKRAKTSLKEALDEAKDTIGREYTEINEMTHVTHKRVQARRNGVPQYKEGTTTSVIVDPSTNRPVITKTRTPIMEDAATGGVRVNKASLKVFAEDRLRGITKSGDAPLDEIVKHIDSSDLHTMRSQLQKIIDGPDFADFKTYQGIRSALYDLTRKTDVAIAGQAQGQSKRLVQLTNDAMEEAAEGSRLTWTSPDGTTMSLADKVRNANASWKQLKTTFNDSVISKIQKSAPEEIHRVFERASVDDIQILKKELPTVDWDELRGKLLADAFNRSTGGEISKSLGIADEVAERAGIVAGQTEATSFKAGQMKNWQENVLDTEKLGKLFTEKELVEINSIIATADLIFGPAAQASSALAFMATSINYGMSLGTATAAYIGGLPAAGWGLLSMGGTTVLGRVLTRQASRSQLLDKLGEYARIRGVPTGAGVGAIAMRQANTSEEDRQAGAERRTMADILPPLGDRIQRGQTLTGHPLARR
jgi:hypothetical protein